MPIGANPKVPPIGESPMQYRELVLEPVEPINESDREASWASGKNDALSSFSLAAETDSLDIRLIKLIKALDR